jgi:NRAMP (natural resistance-associated macrophage protein)-like metal ion transporter
MADPIRPEDRSAEIESTEDPLATLEDGASEAGRPGDRIQDPLLGRVPAGPDVEPHVDELLKGETRDGQPATGGAPAGRTTLDEAKKRGPLAFLQLLGPGLITGASDDDPSGIGTYSQVGSQFGYGMLWMALFTFPMMAAIQELCARIALQTGVGLGIALRRKFPTWLVGICVLGLLAANTINLGADLGAVALGGSMLTRGFIHQSWLVVPVAGLILYLQFFVTYQVIFRVFKWLTLALFAYVVTMFLAHPALIDVVKGTFIPHIEFSRDFITAMVAVLGTTISPYLFFWQASAEVDEMRAAGLKNESARQGVKQQELRAAQTDILIGMAFSQIVMYAIILTSAAVLHAHGKTDVQSADQAAQALAPFLGPFAFIAFAVGMIGTGLLAIPILSGSAAYALKEFMGWKGRLATKPRYRPTFYAIIAAATLAGLAINFIHIDPIRALFWTAVINGMVAPPLMILIVLLGSDRTFMKDKVSGWLSKTLTWAGTVSMTAAALALLVTTFVIR